LHAYKLNGSRSTNTNNTQLGLAVTLLWSVSVRHGLSTETKRNKVINNEINAAENSFLAAAGGRQMKAFDRFY